MAYQNPVVLLDENQLSSFKKEDYKKIKNQILLQFQLSTEPVILWQDRMYDKEEVIQLLEELQENSDLHFEIFKNKPLLSFLEDGEIGFFSNRLAQEQALNNPSTKEDIIALILEGVNRILPDWIFGFGFETTAFLRNIQSFTSKLEPSQVTAAYSSAFEALQSFVTNLETMFPDVFATEDSYNMYKELQDSISREFLQFFRFLPKEFEGLKMRYCMWCNNSVVVSFARKQDKISKFHRKTLHKVIEAAAIAAEVYNRESNLKIASNLEDYLSSSTSNRTGSRSGAGWIFPIIFLIIGIIRIGNSCNNQSSNRYRNDYTSRFPTYNLNEEQIREMLNRQQNSTYHDDTNHIQNSSGNAQQLKTADNLTKDQLKTTDKSAEIINEIIEKKLHDSGLTEKLKPKFVSLKPSTYNGSAAPLPDHIRLVDIKELPLLTVINYETEIIPTRVGSMHDYIPADIRKKYAGKTRDFQINFTRKNMPEVKYAHKLSVKFNEKVEILSGPEIIETNGPLMKIAAIPVTAYKFKGFITLMDQKGKILGQEKIDLEWRENSTVGFYFRLGNKTYSIENLNQKGNDPHEIRMKSVLQNIQILNDMSLQASVANKVFDFWFYDTSYGDNPNYALTESKVIGPKLVTSKDLYFLFKSAEDGIYYFSTANKEVDIKYMIKRTNDGRSSYLKGIQMAVAGSDKSIIERIELFRVY